MRATTRAHHALAKVIQPGEVVVDATCGNGHDTVLLAGLVGAEGRVHGFDIQEAALVKTAERLEAGGKREWVTLHHRSHAEMREVVEAPVAAVTFNLGYLPGGDHALITEAASTLQALEQSWELLRPGGLLSVLCYPDHQGGAEETRAVRSWAQDRQEGPLPPLPTRGPSLLLLHKI